MEESCGFSSKIINSNKYIYNHQLVVGLTRLYSLVHKSSDISYSNLINIAKNPSNELGIILLGRGKSIPVDKSRLLPDKLHYDLSDEEIEYYLKLRSTNL